MANSMPFNSINADRPYKAEDWAWYFGTFIGNGVFPKPETGLQVVANEGMKITVNEGKAFINGYAFKNPSNYEITLDTADGALARIDRVVVRWDLVNRDMYIDVLKGTVSSSPKAVDVTRNSEIYELALADVTVSKGVTSITQAYITDQRFNTALCGIVKGTVEEIDTSVIIAQFENFVKTYQDEQLAEFEEWVESIKDVLDENAAGNLQLQIDAHTEKSVSSENGVHGFRYFEGKLQAHIYDEENMTLKWVTVPGSGIDYNGEKSVKGAIDEVSRTLGYTVSKNLVPYPYYISSSSFVNSGLTWNCDNKGVLTVNGTPTNDCWYNVIHASDKPLLLKKGKYILNGCASGGSNATYRIELLNSNFEVLFSDIGNECEFTLEEDTNVGLRVYVFSGTTLNNAIFKPMISKEGGEFESYVGDLNSRLQYYDYLDIKDKINISTNCHSLISAYVKNGFVHIKGVINESAVIGQNTWLFVINDAKYSPSETMYGNIIYRSSADLNKALDVRIDSSGTCYVWLLNDLAAHTYFSLMYPIN